MSLLWPGLSYCLGILPLIVLAYLWGIKRRRRYTVRMSSLSLVRESVLDPSQWRRHLPFGLLLVSVTSLILAMCRPVIAINIPSKQGIMILALDVSRSMCSPDIQPTRLQALEAALLQFIAAQSPDTKIGVVAFSDDADLIQAPTYDRAALALAIQNLMTGWKRAIGDGIYESLDVITQEEGHTVASRRPGEYAPAVIVLVTNGVSDSGASPLAAAQAAGERGIRIYAVGLSSPKGPLNASCQSSDPSSFGEGSLQTTAGLTGLDVDTLKQIAAMTGGQYFPASGLSGLKNVFQSTQLQTIVSRQNVEVTFAFVILGALFAVISLLLTLVWSPLL